LAPENTIAAFDCGLQMGADGLELDVHLSSDGVPVVIHDPTLERTTDARGPVRAMTAAELARVDAGARFSRAGFPAFPFQGLGLGVPTLGAVLARYPSVPVIVEIKVDTLECGRRVADEVRAARAVDRVCLAGFGMASARGAREALPEAAASACHTEVRWALYRSWVGWAPRPRGYGGFQVPERAGGHHVVSPRFIGAAHRAGLAVEVWTVDEPADMARLLAWGVDGLISNRPDLAVSAREAFCAGARCDARGSGA
jgi:glycerophosphoryl diester phosphodiesterase